MLHTNDVSIGTFSFNLWNMAVGFWKIGNMIEYYMKVVTEKVKGGWQVRIVETDWDVVKVGMTLETGEMGIFNCHGCRLFPSRSAVRTTLRNYMNVFHYVKITGGLH